MNDTDWRSIAWSLTAGLAVLAAAIALAAVVALSLHFGV